MIQHSIPSHNYFAIIQPGSGKTYDSIFRESQGKIFELQDPRTLEIKKAEFVNTWIFPAKNAKFYSGLFLLAFGYSPELVMDRIYKKYPELKIENSRIELWLMKKVDI